MKTFIKVLALFTLLLTATSVDAQRSRDGGGGSSSDESMEVKINPIGILFGSADIAVEKFMSENFGLEGSISFNSRTFTAGSEEFKNTGFGVGVFGKYYFNPDRDCSKFYLAPYVRFATSKGTSSVAGNNDLKNTRVAGGLMLGWKWVSSGKISIELGFGLGRAFVNNYDGPDQATIDLLEAFDIDAVGRFAVGYRF